YSCVATLTHLFSTLSLHDALPICRILPIAESLSRYRAYFLSASGSTGSRVSLLPCTAARNVDSDVWKNESTTCSISTTFSAASADRKSTRLNSSHVKISYAVFCL